MKLSHRVLTLLITGVILISCLSLTAFAAENPVEGVGIVQASSLRLRSEPSTDSKTLTAAPRGELVVILSREGDWYRVNYNLQEGYMHGDYLKVMTKKNAELGYGEVTGSSVNLRSGPDTSYRSLGTVKKGEKCYIIGLNEGWYKVISGKNVCYIRSDYLALTEIPYENKASKNTPIFFRNGASTGVTPSAAALSGNTSSPSAPSGSGSGSSASQGSASGSEILSKAQEYLGCPYVYGGADPSGFDCSGFVYYVLKSVGYSPYRTPADQIKMGSSVSKSDLQPGDIVFFSGTGSSGISHVGIYAGNGQFIHAPNSRSVVSYSSLTSGYWSEHYYAARRMG